MMKYADDTYVLHGLLCNGDTVIEGFEEFDTIKLWATKNNLKIRSNNTKEIIFSCRRYDRIPNALLILSFLEPSGLMLYGCWESS